MSYFTSDWDYAWIALVAWLVVLVHERGLRSINSRSTPAHARARRRRMWLSYAGIAVAVLSVVSPLQFWSMEYFWVHMLQHLTVMLAAPALYVAGAPAVPLLHSIPVRARRRILKNVFLRATRHPLRRICAVVFSPAVGILFFNVVMVAWMLPGLFDPVMARPTLHIGLMLTTFFASGALFWLQFIPSAPLRPRLTPFAQVGALVTTNLIMTFIAITLSFFVSSPSYDFGAMMAMAGRPGAITTLNPLADQHIGAAILWVCGDFWCLPAIVIAFRRAIDGGEASAAMDRFLRGRKSVTAEEFRSGATETATT